MIAALLISAALAASAEAELGFNADPWRPALDGQGFGLESAALPEAGRVDLNLVWTHNPLVAWSLDAEQGVSSSALLGDVLAAHLSASQPWGPLRVGLDAPLLFLARGELGEREIMAGDPELSLKLRALDGPVGLAAQVSATAPLGASARALGEQGLTAGAELLLDARLSRLSLCGNLGYRLLPDQDFYAGTGSAERGDQLTAGLGLGVELRQMLATVELSGALDPRAPLDPALTPVEALFGLRQQKAASQLRGAVGLGLLPGLGAPALRVLVGVGAQAVAPPQEDPQPAVQP